MSFKDKAGGIVGGAVGQKLGGQQPGVFRATAGAAVAGGLTSAVVYRLLRSKD